MIKLKEVVIFTVGALLGGVSAHVITKKRCEKLAEEEIQSIKDMFKRKIEREKAMQETETKEVEDDEEEEDLENKFFHYPDPDDDNLGFNHMTQEYETKAKNYSEYSTPKVDNSERDDKIKELLNRIVYEPEVIDAEEFGTLEGYDTATVTYYADGVLVDDFDEIIDDYEQLVGTEFIKIFNDFNATTVYVRNDEWSVDYEIIRDDWCFSDFQDCPLSPEELNEPIENEKKPHQL